MPEEDFIYYGVQFCAIRRQVRQETRRKYDFMFFGFGGYVEKGILGRWKDI